MILLSTEYACGSSVSSLVLWGEEMPVQEGSDRPWTGTTQEFLRRAVPPNLSKQTYDGPSPCPSTHPALEALRKGTSHVLLILYLGDFLVIRDGFSHERIPLGPVYTISTEGLTESVAAGDISLRRTVGHTALAHMRYLSMVADRMVSVRPCLKALVLADS